jgi:hypothetical protein
MPTSLVEGNSLLAVDIGSVNTRAAFFDVVEGRYRFIGMGQAATTYMAPNHNIAYGVQHAIQNLQNIIGKMLIDQDGRLIIPSQPDGIGVDNFAATISAGPAVKTVVVGLLPDVSLKSIQNLAQTTYTRVVDAIGLNDTRPQDEQVSAILRYGPELFLVAGGTNGGATQSIQKILELIGLSSYLLPEGKRPSLLFAGNQAMAGEVRRSLKGLLSAVTVAPNVRPLPELEDLAPAQRELANLFLHVREKQMPELEEIRMLAGGTILPSAYAQGRMVRFLARYFDSGRGIFSVDLGASSLSAAVSFGGDLHLGVFPQFGIGEPLSGLLKHTNLDDIYRWLPLNVPQGLLREYMYQKSIYPAAIPATLEERHLEQTLVRHLLQLAVRAMLAKFPREYRSKAGLLPAMEPILASGAALTGAATLGQRLLMLLDGLQPVGITTIAIDQNNLLSMLGAAAEQNSLLPIQVIDSGALARLSTVISPVSTVNYGTPIVRAKLIHENGEENETEVKMGNLQILPLESGRTARLELRPLQRADVGLGPGRAIEIEVGGSSLGVVIDARGRPIRLPAEHEKRRDLLGRWQDRMGG